MTAPAPLRRILLLLLAGTGGAWGFTGAPQDTIKAATTTTHERTSPDLFFEVAKDIEDLTRELEELKERIREIQSAGLDTSRTPHPEGVFQAKDKIETEVPNVKMIREQIDSLKKVVRYYDIAEKGLPELDEDVLNILKLPALRHKITLSNGTVVVGQILSEDLEKIVLQTAVGRLVIEKDRIAQYEEKDFPGARVEFEGDYKITAYSDREVFTGMVKNVGKKRADFVTVTFSLWDSATHSVGTGSSFVDGSHARFSTGVISDASIAPGETATYHVSVEKEPGKKVAYRTQDVTWRSYK